MEGSNTNRKKKRETQGERMRGGRKEEDGNQNSVRLSTPVVCMYNEC